MAVADIPGLEAAIIDYLNPDGDLTTYVILPKEIYGKFSIDFLEDIYPDEFSDGVFDIGTIRIYKGEECTIQRYESKIKHFKKSDDEMSFAFWIHHAIGQVSPHMGRSGIYTLILPTRFRLTELNSNKEEYTRTRILWDRVCGTQVIRKFFHGQLEIMGIATILGEGETIEDGKSLTSHIVSFDFDYSVENIMASMYLGENDKTYLSSDISDKIDWLELKPNIAGIGINLNAIIRDGIRHFQRKIQE